MDLSPGASLQPSRKHIFSLRFFFFYLAPKSDTHWFTHIWFLMKKLILQLNIHWEFLWTPETLLSAKSVWCQSLVWSKITHSHNWITIVLLSPDLNISSPNTVSHITNLDSYPWERVCLMVYATFISIYLNIVTQRPELCEVGTWTLLLSSC